MQSGGRKMQIRFGDPTSGVVGPGVHPQWPPQLSPRVAQLPPLVFGPDARGETLTAARGIVLDFGPARTRRLPGGHWFDCSDATIQPGLVDAHTHAYRSLAQLESPFPDPPARQYLNRLAESWWRMDRAVDRWTLAAAARLYVAEALLAGTTTLIDHHESPNFIEGSLDIIADACDEFGIRAVLCYGVTERNDGPEEAERGLLENKRFILSNTRANVRGCVGLDATYALSDETIREAGELCRRLGTVLHAHLGESAIEVRDAQNRGYESPVDRLAQLGALVPGSIVSPGVQLTEAQIERLVEIGCWIVQTPTASEQIGAGYSAALAGCDRVALGTDGHPADMRREATSLSMIARRHGDDAVSVARRTQTARRLASDLFRTDMSLAREGAADAVVAGSDGTRHVIVGGRLVVRDGELVSGNIHDLRNEGRALAERLKRKMDSAA